MQNVPFNWWVGVVEDRNDPMKIGRYRVRIQGYHTEDKAVLPPEDLPWAMTIQPVGSAAVSGVGHDGTGLVTGSTVVGFFTDEECQLPIIMGSLGGVDTLLPNAQSGFFDPNGVYPKEDFIDESSLSRLARGGDVAENHISLGLRRDTRITGVSLARPDEFEGINDPAPTVKNKSDTDDGIPRWDEPRPQGVDKSVSEYPYNKVRETEGGHVFEVDDTPDNKRILNYHCSGSHEEYHHNGDHVQKIVGDDFEIVYKDKTLYVDGDLAISVTGNVNMKVEGDKIEDIGGNLYQTIRKGRFIKVQGNDALEVISDQKVSIDGSRYTVIGCQTDQPPVTIPFVGSLPAGGDNITIKGTQTVQVAGRKNENIGGKYVLSTVGGLKIFSSLGSMEVITLKDINMSTGVSGNFAVSTGNVYMTASTEMELVTTTYFLDASGAAEIDAEGKLTLDGAGGVDVASASNEIDITTGGTVDINGAAISLN